jgi:hypothetical protein
MKQTDEKKIQQECWLWFMENYGKPSHKPQLFMHSVVNGFGVTIPMSIPKVYHEKIRIMIANAVTLLSYTGMVKGVADTMIHGVDGKCIWCEFKTATGDQRKEQIRQQERTEKNGGIYIMPRSLQEFQANIFKHINWLTT